MSKRMKTIVTIKLNAQTRIHEAVQKTEIKIQHYFLNKSPVPYGTSPLFF